MPVRPWSVPTYRIASAGISGPARGENVPFGDDAEGRPEDTSTVPDATGYSGQDEAESTDRAALPFRHPHPKP
jgi:hypothetical protein